jgi:phosphatidylcholine synthase
MKKETVAAVAIHLYTASGAILAFGAMVAVAERGFSTAFLLLLIAFVVDYTDGTMARWLNVEKVLPLIDGTTLDHVVDFLTNAVLPVFIMWQSAVLPAPRSFWMGAILLSTLFRFSKTFNPWLSRGFLSGIPSPWINLAFYAFYYRMGETTLIFLILVMIFLTFLPVGYIHVARFPNWRLANALALSGWWAIYLGITQGWIRDERTWLDVSLVFPAFYLGTSWWFAVRSRIYSKAASSVGS